MTSARSDHASSRRERLDRLLRIGRLVPGITLDRVEDAVPMAQALVSGGLRLLEITLPPPPAPPAAPGIVSGGPAAEAGHGTVLLPAHLAPQPNHRAQLLPSPP